MLEGYEWLIIGGVAIVIIMWGPAKIPEFARAIGRAKGEYSKASKEFENAASSVMNAPKSPAITAATIAPAQVIKTKDEILIETAQNLGISSAGKTREQLTQKISQKVKNLGIT